MKTSTKVIPLLALTLCAGSLASLPMGCSATATRESTGEYVDDSTITARVKTALITDKTVKAGDVTVETFKGVVQLSGFVDTPAQKAQAGQVAGNVRGVREVQNKITVK